MKWWIFIAPEEQVGFSLDSLNTAEALLISFWNEVCFLSNSQRGADKKPGWVFLQQAILLVEAASAALLWLIREKDFGFAPWEIPFKSLRARQGRRWPDCYIISLIQMGGDRWLFAGVHSSHGCDWDDDEERWHYKTKELPEFDVLTGRLVIQFSRSGRQSYLNAENWADQMQVGELMPRRLEVEAFPGFSNVILPKQKLDIIVAQQIASWKSALASVAGVYLITDTKTGRHYVGSAYGEGGIWGRWVAYSWSGHGSNKILNDLLQKEGADYSRNFQFSILETADTNASKDDVLARETHWKNKLCSRECHGGYNAN